MKDYPNIACINEYGKYWNSNSSQNGYCNWDLCWNCKGNFGNRAGRIKKKVLN